MRVNSNLRIKWNHNAERKETACQIVDNNDNIVVFGIARAWHKDPFCRQAGRKVSLTKALNTRNEEGERVLNKATRTQIWNVLKENNVKIIS